MEEEKKFLNEIKEGYLRNFDYGEFEGINKIKYGSNLIESAYLKPYEGGVVLKFLKEYDKDEYYKKFTERIIIQNENVIKFHGVTQDPSKKFHSMVLEFCGNKTLREHLKGDSKQDWYYKIKMAKEIANGLNSSILLDNNCQIKPTISDENVAYVDPKWFDFTLNHKHNKASDIYSLGMILWEISSGQIPFNNSPEGDIKQLKLAIVHGKRETPEVISRLEDIEFDQVFQNHDYVPEISFRNNNASVSRKEACLTVIKGSPQNLYFFLPVGETFIGRNNLNHIIIKDQEVDKKHANIRSSQGKVEITSLSSGSGIFVNGDKLLFRIPYTLERNDKIKMGRCIFQYLPPGEYENRIDQLLPIYNTDYLRKSLNNKFENAKKNNKYLSLLNMFALKIFLLDMVEILLYDTNVKSAYEIAEKIRASVEAHSFVFNEKKLQVTLSIGVSGMNSSVEISTNLLNHAEEACRKAKKCGRNRDPSKISLYTEFAESGNHFDQNILGECYRDGLGTVKDEQKAFEWFQKSAEGGNHLGQCNLGYCFQNGIGVTEDYAKALQWYMKFAEEGNDKTQVILENYYYLLNKNLKNKEKIFSFLKESAENGNSTGQCLLAGFYANEIVAIGDVKKAVYLYKKSAESGNHLGEACLAGCYMNGFGTTKDAEKTFYWCNKSAESGNHLGESLLAFCYAHGYGTIKNDEKAFYWSNKSAEAKHFNGEIALLVCYNEGTGTTKDEEKAIHLLQKYAESGNYFAQSVVNDGAKAFQWLLESVNSGKNEAQKILLSNSALSLQNAYLMPN
ncbi:hypothetical protein C2G38_2178367 [Gigaspora rosea]|uniref:FHA domain-containing protein n=1 Tax=Gigaspora rosea TaxID=44941 RepID=A0A397VG22_9GLOM|nr:hypothetical protein C2G38_2178367 [Gigaspora rosea]